MAEQRQEEDEITHLGRGRGRGALTDPELRARSSVSDTNKRSIGDNAEENSHERADGVRENGNGNGRKRGRMGEDDVAWYTTKPSTTVSKQGMSGKAVQLSANYFQLGRRPTFAFTVCRVDFKPDVELDYVRKSFVKSREGDIGSYLYDGTSLLFLTNRLPEATMVFEVKTLEGTAHKMRIKETGQNITEACSMASQIYNVILRRAMAGLHLQLVGRNLYDPAAKITMAAHKLELWPGYITSIRQHEHNMLVNCEVSHKVMRNELVYDILRLHMRDGGGNWQESFKKEIIGSIVLTRYNNSTYRVDDVDFKNTPNSTFPKRDGTQQSFVEYYEKRYQITIIDRQQCLLVSNPKARDVRGGRSEAVLLVPELCSSTGLTDKMRANFTMMKDLAIHTQMPPELRKNRLLEFANRLINTPESSKQLHNWNTALDRNLIRFEGRALKQEVMLFGNDRTSQNNDTVDWTNPMKTNQMFLNVPLKRWMFVCPNRCRGDAEVFIKLMREVAEGMRYQMGEPKLMYMSDDRLPSYTKTLEECISMDPKLIMVVVPNNAADRYSTIKKITCVNHAVPSQVIVQKTMQPKKGNMGGVKSIATKVVIQLNCKLGGAPWMIKFPLKGVMTIGFDVTHDTNDKSKSYGAFVASMDLKIDVKYYSSVRAHKDGNELSTNIVIDVVQALKAFFHKHGTLPERIFFYRDGVGDGQIQYVHSQEVKLIEEKLMSIYAKSGNGMEVKFSFIIVNKRINSRIFAVQGNRFANPASGTIVDDHITLPERYDFYLVSQSVRQGTVAPTSYNVIHDTNGLTADQLQQITYKNTHLYYNWSGCTRVPASVQYAHKLAFLVGQFLHAVPNQNFDNTLFFL